MEWFIFAQAFWFIAAAYAANAFPPLLKGKMPLDFGKTIGGKRILGNGKTIEGTIGGILFGIFIGSLQIYSFSFIPDNNIGLLEITLQISFLLSLGAVAGDIAGSLIKRRIGMERGESAPLLDQLDFLVGAIIITGILYVPSIGIILILVVLTPIIHIIANIIGYHIKAKNNPW